MGELAAAPSGAEALGTIFRYLSLVAQDLTPQTLLASIPTGAESAKETLMTTMAEQWKAEGRVDGARRVLVRLLELKFGVLPDGERKRLEAASEEQLALWGDRILTAQELASVFAD